MYVNLYTLVEYSHTVIEYMGRRRNEDKHDEICKCLVKNKAMRERKKTIVRE